MENDQHNALNVNLEIKRVPAQLLRIFKHSTLTNRNTTVFSINNNK